jgi:CBS domain-containing protein
MTSDVVTVAPDVPTRHAAELLAAHGFAALPVVAPDGRLLGIVTEADVLRQRMPPTASLASGDKTAPTGLGLLVREVMTDEVRSVEGSTHVSDLACLFVDHHLRSLPVVERDRLVGIVSRRDLLRTLVRPAPEISEDIVRLLEAYTGAADCWEVEVIDGVATVRHLGGTPGLPEAMGEVALQRLVATIPGVVGVRYSSGLSP